jgi:hypothetical protein
VLLFATTLGLWLLFGWHTQWWFVLWCALVTIWWLRAQFRVLRRGPEAYDGSE